LTRSAKLAAKRSNWCRATWRPGSAARSLTGFPTRSAAWTRFTWCSWRPTRWTRSAAKSGNDARKVGDVAAAKDLKGARYALWKNPENLTDRQRLKLADVQKTNQRLYRAYLLKEQLRQIYRVSAEHAIGLLEHWLAWARRSRLTPFVKLAKTISAQRPGIVAAIENDLSNARVEAINTQIRMLTRRAFGFHSANALIALAMLSLAGLWPPLPR
jgi:transposase